MPSCPLHVVIIGEDGGDEGLDGPLQKQAGRENTFYALCTHRTQNKLYTENSLYTEHMLLIEHGSYIVYICYKHSMLNREHTKHAKEYETLKFMANLLIFFRKCPP